MAPITGDGKLLLEVSPSRRNPIKAIRRHCLDCCGGSAIAVLECPSITCALWAFRKGKNPYRVPPTQKQKERALENLNAARQVRKTK